MPLLLQLLERKATEKKNQLAFELERLEVLRQKRVEGASISIINALPF